jgi:hypothetical protein
VYDAEKASAVQKKIQNLKDVWHETEETEDLAGTSHENHSPAGTEPGKVNDLSSSESVLPGKKPVPPSTPPAPLVRALSHRDLRRTSASDTVLIKDPSRNNSSANASLGSGQQAAKIAFTESGTSSLPGDACSKLKAQQSTRKGAGPGAQTSSGPQELLFQQGRVSHENEGMADGDGMRVEEFSDSD